MVTAPQPFARTHGGPDRHGRARWDFSTNANAVGPSPHALAAVRSADETAYPDPHYHALRDRLSQWHGVAPHRILVAASASEFIQRITAVSARIAPGGVAVPLHAYGDYAVAARACGRPVVSASNIGATLHWHCDPSSPLGQEAPPPTDVAAITVLDAVYAPLRLEGESAWGDAARNAAFELHSPNKALGLTGVRGAYAIAPATADERTSALIDGLTEAAPSWPLGAHAVAMLHAWTSPHTQAWLAESRYTLRAWKRSQTDMLQDLGADVDDSVTNFFCARLPAACTAHALRAFDVAVRDTASFGLAGRVRLSVQPPASQDRFATALQALSMGSTSTRRMA